MFCLTMTSSDENYLSTNGYPFCVPDRSGFLHKNSWSEIHVPCLEVLLCLTSPLQ